MNNIKFSGIMPALITPFDSEGRLLSGTVKRLMDYELSGGVNGFYICGSTGEGPVLDVKTRIEMSETVCEHCAGRGAVIEHIGSPNFSDVLKLARHSDSSPVDAVSSLAPNFYFKYSDDEIVDYYKAIAQETSKPLLVYATGMLNTGTLEKLIERLMKIPNIIGLKYTLPDYYLMSKLRMLNGGDINIINGPDEMLLCGLSMGAQGGIGSTYNVMPDWFSQLYAAFAGGNIDSARELQFKINRVIDALLRWGNTNIIRSIKAVLQMKGFETGTAAFPARGYTDCELEKMKAEFEQLGIVFAEG